MAGDLSARGSTSIVALTTAAVGATLLVALAAAQVSSGAGGSGDATAGDECAASGRAGDGGDCSPIPPPARAAPRIASEAAAAVASVGTDDYPRFPAVKRKKGARVWSVEELALHNGTDLTLPLLLAVVGEVYDVGTGKQHYAPHGGYAGMAGRDASRALTSGNFSGEGLTSKLDGLAGEQVRDVIEWRNFYRHHETYRFVGFLEGRFFDKSGAATEERRRVQNVHRGQEQLLSLEKDLRKRFMQCNTKFVHKNPFIEIWCDDAYHSPGSVPVYIYYRFPRKTEEESYCACVPLSQRQAVDAEAAELAARPQITKIVFRLVDYTECEKGAQRCSIPKGAKKPT